VDTRRRACVDDLRLGDGAVRHDRQVPLCCQNVRRPPVHLDDPSVGPALDANPITWSIGATYIQYDAEKHIAQRALQRQPEDDRDRARGR